MYIIFGIIAGACFILNKSINMLLSNETGIFSSNFINHLTGLLGSIIVLFISLIFIPMKGTLLSGIPFYGFLGGVLGATFVVLSNHTFSKTSVITSSILILAGQFLSSIIFDLIVLKHNLQITKILGAVLIILAILLYSSEKNE
ncbi:MAG: DMT family transporter [Bacillota bacterium]|nr:DMT family transporter [Bacillota bacterium]